MKNKNLDMLDTMKRTLKLKEAQYKEVCAWFENEYNSSSNKDEVEEWVKNGIELNAQIELLRYLIS
jgi:hypothetical protein